ncbi:hypothetical protein BJX65DRAFT_197148 [Aspergillus insuetus]
MPCLLSRNVSPATLEFAAQSMSVNVHTPSGTMSISRDRRTLASYSHNAVPHKTFKICVGRKGIIVACHWICFTIGAIVLRSLAKSS